MASRLLHDAAGSHLVGVVYPFCLLPFSLRAGPYRANFTSRVSGKCACRLVVAYVFDRVPLFLVLSTGSWLAKKMMCYPNGRRGDSQRQTDVEREFRKLRAARSYLQCEC